MRLLLFFAPHFAYTPHARVLEDAPEARGEGQAWRDAVVVFYQCEAEDPDKGPALSRKVLKNIKWLAGKFATRQIVLHSFNHLSSSKAPPGFAATLMTEVRKRLEDSGYAVGETPFGYLNAWSIDVAGESLAKVFKEL